MTKSRQSKTVTPGRVTTKPKASMRELRAGFAEAEFPVPAGARFARMSPDSRLSTGHHKPFFFRVAIFESDGVPCGIAVLDTQRMRETTTRILRSVMTEATGIPPERFAVCGTHTHNGPTMDPWQSRDSADAIAPVRELLAGIARRAADRLAPARLRFGRIAAPGLACSRRPIYRAADGREQVGTHGPRSGADFLRMESPDETELRALLVEDVQGKPLGGFVNFACHATTMYSEPLLSPDYPGAVAERMAEKTGGIFIFMNGAAGNQAPNRCNYPGAANYGGPAGCAALGQALADKAVEALAQGDTVKPGIVAVASECLTLPHRELTAAMIETAQAHLEARRKGESMPPLAPRLYGFAEHFHGNPVIVDDWFAADVLGMWEWRRRASPFGLTEPVEVQAIRIGEAAFVFFPCEMFNAFGHEVQEKSPFRATLVACYANGSQGYMPQEEDFEHGGFECCYGHHSRLARNAGRRLTDTALALLHQLAGRPS